MKARNLVAYRLGLDLGSNSLGWFIVWLKWNGSLKRWEPLGLGPGGVRIFPDGRDPQSGTSNAVDRRMARSARKRRDRFVDRREQLMQALVRHGLMPAEETARKALEGLDPYELRAKALGGALPVHHVGRAFFHLNQRRGFLSNRKAERKKDDDKGAIKQGEARLKEAMAAENAPTLGAFLWTRQQKREGVRARAIINGTKASYDFYPTRGMFLDEFNVIWDRQSPHHATMTAEARKEIEHIIFYQRPLKDPVVGKCTLSPATTSFAEDPEGYRCPWAHPLAQRFRIYQEARNLEIRETGKGSRKLTKEQSDAVARALLGNGTVKFDKLRTLLKLPSEAKFNLESERRKELDGDETAARLASKPAFGKAWYGLGLERQCAIVETLREAEDEDGLIAWLETECGLSPEAAARAANTALPEGHARVGLRAIGKMLPFLQDGLAEDGVSGVNYHEAATRADYNPAKQPDGVLSLNGYLPYYGEWLPDAVVGTGDERDTSERRHGYFPNPTVHIGLGQLRRIVNELIRQYGPPTEISIEFTRALKLSPKEKVEKQREQRINQDKNEQRRTRIREDLGNAHYDPTPRDLLKVRLWEELGGRDGLDRKCPYSGETISLRRLMSEEVDIDHILPFAMTLDDSAANKTICMREANRFKRKQTPFEAFGTSPGTYRWDEIVVRAASLPKNKRWRFDANAREEFEKRGGFIARQLNEAGWLARLAKQYLGAVTNPYDIWVVPGRLTAMIRGKWGLNSLLPDHNYGGVKERAEEFMSATDDMEFSGVKNRADHRHHAIDALVVALTDRSLLWKMANAYDEDRARIEIPTPWEKDKLRDDLKAALDRMTVSHKPDHGVQGKLHEDTAYGFVKEPEKEGGNLVYRKPIESLNENEIARIRDARLRDLVRAHVDAEKAKGAALRDALHKLREPSGDAHIKNGLRHVRLLKPEKAEYLVPIASRGTGEPYKAYSAGENFCIEIYETPVGRWEGETVRRFDANKPAHDLRWRTDVPDAKFVMRVHKGDLLRLDHDGRSQVMVVHRLDAAAGRFKLAAHNETGNLDRRHATDNEIDPFRWLMASYNTLKRANAERVRVDELGRLWRIG